MSATANPDAALALDSVPLLRGAQDHSTVILSQTDQEIFRKLGIDITCEPDYENKKLYHK